jgi:uncharacterized membrane protein
VKPQPGLLAHVFDGQPLAVRISAARHPGSLKAGSGGGLLVAGLILMVAENWEALHRAVKLGGWALLQRVFLLAAHNLGRNLEQASAGSFAHHA